MLELTLATRFAAGTNVKGSALGASWRFALPTLRFGRALYLGRPTVAGLAALAQTADAVVVLAPDDAVAATLAAEAAAAGLTAVSVRPFDADGRGWPEPGSVGLLVVGRDAPPARGRKAALVRLVEHALEPGGSAWLEARGRGMDALRELERRSTAFWLAPPRGEAEAVAPLDDGAAVAYLRRRARQDSGVRRPPLERLGRAVRWSRAAGALRPRRAVLFGPDGRAVPSYLRRLAAEAGLDLEGWRFAIAAPGRYASKKVLCYLFEPRADRPTLVAKLPRDPAFNVRLENERRALELLGQRVPGGGFPTVVFGGHHAGLAVVAETVLEGAPFRRRTTGRPECPLAQAAIAWLTELAATTADRSASGAEAAAVLAALLEQFQELYRLPGHERALLDRQLEHLAAADQPLPLVFQHGDPGTWNVLATEDGGVAFLDWEAAEPSGMPLWDLFYFARSFGRTIGGDGGIFGPPAVDRVVGAAVARYCDRIGLDRAAVEPLFHFCWLHRALKEATRLPPERLPSARYLALLRRHLDADAGRPLAAILPLREQPGRADNPI